MIEFETREKNEAVAEAVERGEPGRVVSFRIGNREYASSDPERPGFSEGVVEHAKDAYALVLTASVGERLAGRMENAPVSVDAEFGGVEVPRFRGYLARPKPRSRGAFVAASLGSFLPGAKMGRFVELPNTPADLVVRRGLRICRMPYPAADVSPGPTLNLVDDKGFERNASAADLLSVVKTPGSYLFKDDVFGNFSGAPEPGTGAGRRQTFSYDENDPGVGWEPPDGQRQPYTEVEVFREDDEGNDAFPPQKAGVDLFGLAYPPPVPIPLQIPFEDATPQAPQNARRLARRRAAEGAEISGETALSVPYDPRIEKGDVGSVVDREIAEGGHVERTWTCVVLAIKDSLAWRLDLIVLAVLGAERFVPERRRIELRRSRSVVRALRASQRYPSPNRYPSPTRYPN